MYCDLKWKCFDILNVEEWFFEDWRVIKKVLVLVISMMNKLVNLNILCVCVSVLEVNLRCLKRKSI